MPPGPRPSRPSGCRSTLSPPTFDATFEKPDANAFTVQPAPAPLAGTEPAPAGDAALPTTDLTPAPESLAPALPTALVASPPVVPPAAATAATTPRVAFTN